MSETPLSADDEVTRLRRAILDACEALEGAPLLSATDVLTRVRRVAAHLRADLLASNDALASRAPADTARLDWLEANAELIRNRNAPGPHPYDPPQIVWDNWDKQPLREAIDAARVPADEPE